MDNKTASKITHQLLEILTEVAPKASMKSMYGGTVIELIEDKPKTRIGGFYGYAEHVTLEFTAGADLADPAHELEGCGKKRRHLKLSRVEDIADKGCRGFLEQAIEHYQQST